MHPYENKAQDDLFHIHNKIHLQQDSIWEIAPVNNG